jgi:epoxyqueuosine reductase
VSNASQLKTPNAKRDLRGWLNAAAAGLGFSLVGIGPASIGAENENGLSAFLDNAFEGDMDWLRTTATQRMQPQNMWPDAKSAIVLGMNYGPDHNPMDNLSARTAGNISVYARGRDYHDVLKGKLKQLASQFSAKTGNAVKVFVDTAPLMEKPLAQQAGLGWQGKHTNLVSRQAGSWLFLGIILTDATLSHDIPETDHCGGCRQCLDICPTNAFPAPYRLDARRCISYLTIEHKGVIAREFRRAVGNRIFGCDDCLAICPWNKFASQAHEQKLVAKAGTDLPPLDQLLLLDDARFRHYFAKTPVRRAGYDRFMRNILIAAGNSDDTALVPLVRTYLDYQASVVRAMAVWALSQLMDQQAWTTLRHQYLPAETDDTVRTEWNDRHHF